MKISFTASGLILFFACSLLTQSGCREEKVPVVENSVLSILIWEDYLPPRALEKFSQEFRTKLSITEIENSEQLKQLLSSRPDGFDIVVADEKTMEELADLRLLLDLNDYQVGAEIADIEPFLTEAFDSESRYTAPYLWGLTVMAGKTEALKGAEPSWNLLWREDLKIGLLDEPSDLMWVALLALGHDPALATKDQIDEAAAKLAKRFPDFARTMLDQVTALDQLESGELDLVMTYNGDALTRMAEIPGIGIVMPREGAPLWLDSFAISRDAPNAALALQFISYMSRPEISALSASELNYATPNRAALPMIDRAILENPSLYPASEQIGKCSFVRFPSETEKYVGQAMLGIISGSRSRSLALEAAERETSSSKMEETTD